MKKWKAAHFVLSLIVFISVDIKADDDYQPEMSPEASSTKHDDKVFKSDPSYEVHAYDVNAQLKIYGGKREVANPRPLLELGRRIYESGPLKRTYNFFGDKNPNFNQFAIYGDLRTALAFNDNGTKEIGQIATRLNLDLDYRFTATERLHAFVRPLDRNGSFSRCEFFGNDETGCDSVLNANIEAFFFEGDLGAIVSGINDDYVSWDLPFSIGLMPLLFQNGVWVEDAFTGLAFTFPAMNSKTLDITNVDITFFAGFDDVSTSGVVAVDGSSTEDDVNIYGVTAFVDAMQGYWEMGYGYTDGQDALDDSDYHNFTFAFTKRYRNKISNSIRFISNVGQNLVGRSETADGYLLLIENSLITSKPSTFIPYFNAFIGIDRPQSLARAADAGGVLKNTGINFETDGVTGFPKLDDTANNTWGGALGLSYLFNLDQQLVVEIASVQVRGGNNSRVAKGDQYALGIRYQKPLDEKWIFRADAIASFLDKAEDQSGIRLEIRRKF